MSTSSDDDNGDIRTIVFDNLDAAFENHAFAADGELNGETAEQIADDMILNAEDCEDLAAIDILPFVREWLAEYEKAKKEVN